MKSTVDVNITQTSLHIVKPALQVQEHWFPLSNMDRVMPTFYVRYYAVYESAKHGNFRDMISSLKRSLSEVLVPYYPLAGRMKDPQEGIYNVHCNGTGAEFAEAHADCDLKALDYHQPGLTLGRLLAPTNILHQEDGSLPPVCIQVTRFKCGGVIIACSCHHQIVDMYSIDMFLNAWSQTMRSQPLSRLPFHWRSLLQARNPPKPTVDHSNEYVVKPSYEPMANKPRTRSLEEQQPIVSKTFHFDHKALSNLKREVTGNGKYGPFSSTVCVSTYLWRLIMRANGYADDENANGKLFIGVDGRRRPPNSCVTQDFFGNMIAYSRSNCSMGELIDQPLWNAASVVKRSILKASDEYFRSLIDYVAINKGSAVIPNINVFKDKFTIISSVQNLGMYEVDFGWGKPEFAGIAALPEGASNFVFLLPSPLGHGNLNASIYLRADHMEKLESDPEFKVIAATNKSRESTNFSSTHQHFVPGGLILGNKTLDLHN